MADITLSSAVRTNLSALQSTTQLLSGVQEKLSTGKKVNSALDDPNAFFTASALESRASDLSNVQDDLGQAVSTIQAADNAISAISELVDSAKAKANQALQTSDPNERTAFAKEYNELLTQIEDVAKDAGYKGKNLVGGTGNDLDVAFNESGSSSLDISSVDYTDVANLGLTSLAEGATESSGDIALGSVSNSSLLSATTDLSLNDSLTVTDSAGDTQTITVEADTTVQDLRDFLGEIDGVSTSLASDGDLTIESGQDITLSFTQGAGSSTTGAAFIADFNGDGAGVIDATESGFQNDADVEAVLNNLEAAKDTLRSQASTFGTNLSIVENRQDFTEKLIGTLEEGAGKLTLADTNEEGANLLALQTQQSLASTSLSLATQSDQNVLRLF
ncbi:MAG: flagellin [Stappiaceae bacterium]